MAGLPDTRTRRATTGGAPGYATLLCAVERGPYGWRRSRGATGRVRGAIAGIGEWIVYYHVFEACVDHSPVQNHIPESGLFPDTLTALAR